MKNFHDWNKLHSITSHGSFEKPGQTHSSKRESCHSATCSGLVSAETNLMKRKKEGSTGADWSCPNNGVARLQCIEATKARTSFPTQLPGQRAGVPPGPLWLRNTTWLTSRLRSGITVPLASSQTPD